MYLGRFNNYNKHLAAYRKIGLSPHRRRWYLPIPVRLAGRSQHSRPAFGLHFGEVWGLLCQPKQIWEKLRAVRDEPRRAALFNPKLGRWSVFPCGKLVNQSDAIRLIMTNTYMNSEVYDLADGAVRPVEISIFFYCSCGECR